MTTNEQRAAAKGAALLDERIPGWHMEIDLDSLDVSDACRCVMGQIGRKRFPLDEDLPLGAHTPYGAGITLLWPNCYAYDLLWPNCYDEDEAEEYDENEPLRYGFESDDFGEVWDDDEGGGTTYEGLTDAWKDEILKRREG